MTRAYLHGCSVRGPGAGQTDAHWTRGFDSLADALAYLAHLPGPILDALRMRGTIEHDGERIRLDVTTTNGVTR